MTINGNTTKGGTLTVGGTTTLNSTLTVAGTTTLNSSLIVSGVTTLSTNVWNKSSEGHNRLYFGSNSTTYFGSNAGYIFRNSIDATDVLTIGDSGSLTMGNNCYFYGGNNLLKRSGVFLSGTYGGGYYYNLIDYTSYVSSENGTEYCFRITAYNVGIDMGSSCLLHYIVWVNNSGGTRTNQYLTFTATPGCGIGISTVNNNLSLTYPNNTSVSGSKHIIFENLAYTNS